MRYDFLYRYGDIFALNLNDKTNFVFVCDLDTMEDIGKQDNFSFRQDPWKEDFGAIFEWMRGGINVPAGVIGSSGKTWKEQRRFALRQLKGTFGFGFGTLGLGLGSNPTKLSGLLSIWGKQKT